MKYYTSYHDEGSDLVVVKAKNKAMVRVLLNEDCDCIEEISAKEAKRLVKLGWRFFE